MMQKEDLIQEVIKSNGPVRIGIGGPVGVGKTTVTERLCRHMAQEYAVGVVTNDIYTQEDAMALVRAQVLPEDRIIGVETGGCPHTAIREDVSLNLRAIETLKQRHEQLDIVFVESGGDNLAATFSPDLADMTLYVISVCQGGDIPRKGGVALTRSDLLIMNKTDLAPYVGVDLDILQQDCQKARGQKPFLMTDMSRGQGVEEVVCFIKQFTGI